MSNMNLMTLSLDYYMVILKCEATKLIVLLMVCILINYIYITSV